MMMDLLISLLRSGYLKLEKMLLLCMITIGLLLVVIIKLDEESRGELYVATRSSKVISLAFSENVCLVLLIQVAYIALKNSIN